LDGAIKAHVDRIVSIAWFTRAWVVQEATLATDVKVFCGLSGMTWVAFARAIETLRFLGRVVDIHVRQCEKRPT
jgi:hypothetical protein